MDYTIHASQLSADHINLPRSKSISNRVLIINALCENKCNIENLSHSDDTQVLLEALLLIQQNNAVHPLTIDVGPAGTAYRFLTAFLAQQEGVFILTGSSRMKQRPIKLLVESLLNQGANIHYVENEGFPPLKIEGKKLNGGEVHIQGNISSQYISALLLSAPCMKGGVKLIIENTLTSKPYVQMTLNIMKQFGIAWKWNKQIIEIPEQTYTGIPFTVESDWSAASYWYELLSFYPHGELFLQGLEQQSLQGDSVVADLFKSLGVKTEYEASGVRIIREGEPVESLEYDFIDCPDLAQTLVVTCVALGVHFYFQGLSTLKVKETNRIQALMQELSKIGYILEEPQEGALVWCGKTKPQDDLLEFETYEDHRMAMAFAPLSYFSPIKIKDVEVVSKSYPHFWDDLRSIGYKLQTEHPTIEYKPIQNYSTK